MTAPVRALQDVGGSLTRETLTLTQAARSFLRWAEAHGYAKNTLQSYGIGLSEFLRYAGGVKLRTPSDVTILVLDGFFVWLRDRRRAATTVRHRRAVLVALWRWLVHEGLADRNVAEGTWRIKVGQRMPQYLEPHQVDALLAGLAGLTDRIGRRDYALLATLFYGGLRVGEASALRLDSVDLVSNRIKILHGKGDRDRTIVLAPRLAPILRQYIEEVRPAMLARPLGHLKRTSGRRKWHAVYIEDGVRISRTTHCETREEAQRVLAGAAAAQPATPMLFVVRARKRTDTGRVGLGLLERAMYLIVRKRAQQILGVRLSPHGLRHACASYLIQHGAQPETVQKHLGHARLSTTLETYVHIPRKFQEAEIAQAFA